MPTHIQRADDFAGNFYNQTAEPSSPADGDVWFDGAVWRRYVTDGWVINHVVVADTFDGLVTIGGAEPASPTTGDLWYDGNEWLRWDGADFFSISGSGGPSDPTEIHLTMADAFHWTSPQAFANHNAHYPFGVPFENSGTPDGFWMLKIPESWTTFSIDIITFVPAEETGDVQLSMEFIDIRDTENNQASKAAETLTIPANDLFTGGTSIVSTAGVVDAAGNGISGETVQVAVSRDSGDVADDLAETLYIVGMVLTQES